MRIMFHVNFFHILSFFANRTTTDLNFSILAQQEDDEMVIQVVYVFYAIITHEELSESLMGGSAHVGSYLIDLMHDKNVPIRAICDRALSIIAVSFYILSN